VTTKNMRRESVFYSDGSEIPATLKLRSPPDFR
jgi:hypothetical protein